MSTKAWVGVGLGLFGLFLLSRRGGGALFGGEPRSYGYGGTAVPPGASPYTAQPKRARFGEALREIGSAFGSIAETFGGGTGGKPAGTAPTYATGGKSALTDDDIIEEGSPGTSLGGVHTW